MPKHHHAVDVLDYSSFLHFIYFQLLIANKLILIGQAGNNGF